jgi:hypothetical protein
MGQTQSLTQSTQRYAEGPQKKIQTRLRIFRPMIYSFVLVWRLPQNDSSRSTRLITSVDTKAGRLIPGLGRLTHLLARHLIRKQGLSHAFPTDVSRTDSSPG